ncbi:MAG: efflux RND transporter periplasmic adaptor subunit [Candidatus Omnitrophota bacterium]
MGNIKSSVMESLKSLPLDKIPFLNKFFAKEEALPLPDEMPEEAILVKVYKVARRDFEDTLPSLGTVKGYREMDLRFEINGVVDSMNFREGEEVREGDIIASLDQYDALLKLKYAQIELDKSKKLFEIGSIIKAKLEQSELEYESAKSDLDKTYLYAPRDSVLGTRDAEIGEFVTSNDKIVTLIDDADVFVEIGIIERDIGKVRVGQNAKVYVDTYPDIDFKGKVDNISPIIEGRSRTQTNKIRISNTKRLLLPGMFARVLVDVYTKENAIVIPNTALNKTEEGYVVFVVHMTEVEDEEGFEEEPEEVFIEEEVGESGVAEARPILFEYRSSDFSVIKEGIEDGELVVVETQEKLNDQMNVIVTEVQEQFL